VKRSDAPSGGYALTVRSSSLCISAHFTHPGFSSVVGQGLSLSCPSGCSEFVLIAMLSSSACVQVSISIHVSQDRLRLMGSRLVVHTL